MHYPVAYARYRNVAALRIVDDEILVRMVVVSPARKCLFKYQQLMLKVPIKHP